MFFLSLCICACLRTHVLYVRGACDCTQVLPCLQLKYDTPSKLYQIIPHRSRIFDYLKYCTRSSSWPNWRGKSTRHRKRGYNKNFLLWCYWWLSSPPLLSKTQIRNSNSFRISNTLKLLSSHTMQFINQYVYSNQRKSLQRREKIVPERKKKRQTRKGGSCRLIAVCCLHPKFLYLKANVFLWSLA